MRRREREVGERGQARAHVHHSSWLRLRSARIHHTREHMPTLGIHGKAMHTRTEDCILREDCVLRSTYAVETASSIDNACTTSGTLAASSHACVMIAFKSISSSGPVAAAFTWVVSINRGRSFTPWCTRIMNARGWCRCPTRERESERER